MRKVYNNLQLLNLEQIDFVYSQLCLFTNRKIE